MPKSASSFELTLTDRPQDRTLTGWLFDGLRHAILEGRLRPGTRLPATRDLARQYRISRGIVVDVYEQLLANGYVSSRVGAGTWVNRNLPEAGAVRRKPLKAAERYLPEALTGLAFHGVERPFRMHSPALSHFPAGVWARVAACRLRQLHSWLHLPDDGRGYRPLCRAVADYLGSSRGVKCGPEQVAIVSGVQQGLDLLARLLLRPGDPVWMEDPGYFGAIMAFRNAGARMIPVPIDAQGISVSHGRKACPAAKGAYVTPGHQFPLGTTMSLERRLALISWAGEAGAFVIEDDYDSEFRFEGRPQPALQSLDSGSHVIFVGTFNKLLFPSLRLGYVVLPPDLVDPFLALRCGTDLRSASLDQAILCDFIVEGHLGRHLRRMRELYAGRLAALLDAGRQYLGGLLEISKVRAGLYTAGLLANGMSSHQAETLLAAHEVQTMGLHRFTLGSPDPRGLVLGFAAFDERQIRQAVVQLAAALESRKSGQGST